MLLFYILHHKNFWFKLFYCFNITFYKFIISIYNFSFLSICIWKALTRGPPITTSTDLLCLLITLKNQFFCTSYLFIFSCLRFSRYVLAAESLFSTNASILIFWSFQILGLILPPLQKDPQLYTYPDYLSYPFILITIND